MFGEWTDEEEHTAQLLDAISRFISLVATGTTEGARRELRPEDLEARVKAAQQAKSVRKQIETTEWEEVS